jgi:hypothetical protein
MGITGLTMVLGGKYEEAETMDRQTLALSEAVLRREHPDTLMTMHNLAYPLAKLCCHHESFALYERACAGYYTVLREDHPTTRACCQHYAMARVHATQIQRAPVLASATPHSNIGVHTRKISKIARGLAKIGIRSSKTTSK